MWIVIGLIAAIIAWQVGDWFFSPMLSVLLFVLGCALHKLHKLKAHLNTLLQEQEEQKSQLLHVQNGLEQFSKGMVSQIAQINLQLARPHVEEKSSVTDFNWDVPEVPVTPAEPTQIDKTPEEAFSVQDFSRALDVASAAPHTSSAPIAASPDTAVSQPEIISERVESLVASCLNTSVNEPTDTGLPSPPHAIQEPTQNQQASQPVFAKASELQVEPALKDPHSQTIEEEFPIFAIFKNWLIGGNPLVRVGIVLLFLGVGFLLRYVAQSFVFPVGLRYVAVALCACGGFAFGWRKRHTRPDFALLIQGGAFALLYLTIFAALRLHPLLSNGLALVLMIAVVAFAACLAVLQNAQVLAWVAFAGGFAAPILCSTGSNNYSALFVYYLILNSAILGIAWFKAWRPLNLLGFFATFFIGLAWGLRSYQTQDYPAVQGFVIAFFAQFLLMGLLFARRSLLDDATSSPPEDRNWQAWRMWLSEQTFGQRYADGTLLIGMPFSLFAIQYAITEPFVHAQGVSAFILGGVYLTLAVLIRSIFGRACQLLAEVYLSLGFVFSSLAIPLLLDAQWTAAVWAVEGALLYVLGLRQGRPVARGFALCLQAGALIHWGYDLQLAQTKMDLQQSAMGLGLIGLSALSNAFYWRKALKCLDANPESSLTPLAHQWDASLRHHFDLLGLWILAATIPLSAGQLATSWGWMFLALVYLWVGLRQSWSTWSVSALLLQCLAGLVWIPSWDSALFAGYQTPAFDIVPMAHWGFITPLALGLSGFLMAYGWQRVQQKPNPLNATQWGICSLILAGGWWMWGWWHELERILSPVLTLHAYLGVMALSALLTVYVASKSRWLSLAWGSLVVLFIWGCTLIGDVYYGAHPFAAWGWLAYPCAVLAYLASLRYLVSQSSEPQDADEFSAQDGLVFVQLLSIWLSLGLLAWQGAHLFSWIDTPYFTWQWLGGVLPCLCYLVWAIQDRGHKYWPIRLQPAIYFDYAVRPIMSIGLVWVLVSAISFSGNPLPVPYLPILNPIEALQIAILVATGLWVHRRAPIVQPEALKALLGLGLLVYTCIILRAIHHFTGIPYVFSDLWHFKPAQAAVSIAWSLCALVLVIVGYRRAVRALWFCGAGLFAVVVAKLFLVEMANSNDLARIVSFIVVALVCVVAGYFAPLPKKEEDESV